MREARVTRTLQPRHEVSLCYRYWKLSVLLTRPCTCSLSALCHSLSRQVVSALLVSSSGPLDSLLRLTIPNPCTQAPHEEVPWARLSLTTPCTTNDVARRKSISRSSRRLLTRRSLTRCPSTPPPFPITMIQLFSRPPTSSSSQRALGMMEISNPTDIISPLQSMPKRLEPRRPITLKHSTASILPTSSSVSAIAMAEHRAGTLNLLRNDLFGSLRARVCTWPLPVRLAYSQRNTDTLPLSTLYTMPTKSDNVGGTSSSKHSSADTAVEIS